MSDFIDDSFVEAPKKRPVFLTVLCILTFVSCGLTFLSAGFGIVMGGQQQKSYQAMQQLQHRQQQTDMPEIFDNMMSATDKLQEWTVVANYLSLGNVLICFAGAMLMWKLKKAGFFIYIFGQIIPFIALYGMYAALQGVPIVGPFMLIAGFASALFAIGFIIMYGVNLKHMR